MTTKKKLVDSSLHPFELGYTCVGLTGVMACRAVYLLPWVSTARMSTNFAQSSSPFPQKSTGSLRHFVCTHLRRNHVCALQNKHGTPKQ